LILLALRRCVAERLYSMRFVMLAEIGGVPFLRHIRYDFGDGRCVTSGKGPCPTCLRRRQALALPSTLPLVPSYPEEPTMVDGQAHLATLRAATTLPGAIAVGCWISPPRA
jgi:hypothetical protein